MFTESFSCFWVANTQATCVNETPRSSEVQERLCHPLSVTLSKITWTQRELINQQAGNVCGSHGTKGHNQVPWLAYDHTYILGNKRKRTEAYYIFIHQRCFLFLLYNDTTTLGQSGPGSNSPKFQNWSVTIRCNLEFFIGHS